MPLLQLQVELESSASRRLRSLMTTATSTKTMKLIRSHQNTLTTLIKMRVVMHGHLLKRRPTVWLRIACTTTAFTRETSS